MKRSLATVMAVLFVGGVAFGTRVDVTQANAHTAAVSMDKYGATTLNPVGMRKVSGAAAIFSQGGRLYVAVSVSGLKPMSTHAEHIHAGTCGSNGPIKYPLANLVGDARGNATAVTRIAPTSVARSGWYVNVHANDAKLTPIACGNVHRVTMAVNLAATGGGSGHGVALLTKVAKGTEVVVYVTHLGGAGVHAEHLHAGRCGSNGPIKYPLANLMTNARGDGTSVTLLRGTIPMSGLYVNVHASTTNLKPVACGNLGAAPSSSGGPGGYSGRY
jgi:CHRD domain